MSLGTLSARMPRFTAHEYARDSLRRAILRGELETGSRVPQVAWAKRLEMSTTPIREALRDLATEGMVELDAHRGAFVNRLTFDQVAEIYHIRKLLEPAAMRDAARLITPATMRASSTSTTCSASNSASAGGRSCTASSMTRS